jgi:hypothetical protein
MSDNPEPMTATGGVGRDSRRGAVPAAINSRETPQNGSDVFGRFVYDLLRVLGRRLWRVDILRQNRRNLESG